MVDIDHSYRLDVAQRCYEKANMQLHFCWMDEQIAVLPIFGFLLAQVVGIVRICHLDVVQQVCERKHMVPTACLTDWLDLTMVVDRIDLQMVDLLVFFGKNNQMMSFDLDCLLFVGIAHICQ